MGKHILLAPNHRGGAVNIEGQTVEFDAEGFSRPVEAHIAAHACKIAGFSAQAVPEHPLAGIPAAPGSSSSESEDMRKEVEAEIVRRRGVEKRQASEAVAEQQARTAAKARSAEQSAQEQAVAAKAKADKAKADKAQQA